MAIRALLVVCFGLSAFPTLTLAQEKLPRGPQPYQALATVDQVGKLTLKRLLVQWAPITSADPRNKGAMITQYVAKTELQPFTYTQDQVQAYDVRGNRIATKRLRKLLNDETPVLVSADGAQVDSLHLRLYKDDIVVLLIPAAATSPPIGISEAPPTIVPAPANGEKYYPPVVSPKGPSSVLKLEITGPPEAKTHDETLYLIRVTNTSNTKIKGVRLRVTLPDQLAPVPNVVFDGDRALMTRLADLDPGSTREESLRLRADKTGVAQISAILISDGDEFQVVSFRTNFVNQPVKAEKK